MLWAMNTGHEGSLSTCHANSPLDALRRLEMMVLSAGLDLPMAAVRDQLSSSLDLVVQVARTGRRRAIDRVDRRGGRSRRARRPPCADAGRSRRAARPSPPLPAGSRRGAARPGVVHVKAPLAGTVVAALVLAAMGPAPAARPSRGPGRRSVGGPLQQRLLDAVDRAMPSRRGQRRDRQLPDALDRLGSSLRAGEAVGAALVEAGRRGRRTRSARSCERSLDRSSTARPSPTRSRRGPGHDGASARCAAGGRRPHHRCRQRRRGGASRRRRGGHPPRTPRGLGRGAGPGHPGPRVGRRPRHRSARVRAARRHRRAGRHRVPVHDAPRRRVPRPRGRARRRRLAVDGPHHPEPRMTARITAVLLGGIAALVVADLAWPATHAVQVSPIRRGRCPRWPVASTAATAVVAVGAIAPPLVLLGALGWFGTREVRRRRARHAQRRAIRHALPDLVDLLRLATTAGLTLAIAHPLVAPHVAPPVGPALLQADTAASRGRPRADALLDALAPLRRSRPRARSRAERPPSLRRAPPPRPRAHRPRAPARPAPGRRARRAPRPGATARAPRLLRAARVRAAHRRSPARRVARGAARCSSTHPMEVLHASDPRVHPGARAPSRRSASAPPDPMTKASRPPSTPSCCSGRPVSRCSSITWATKTDKVTRLLNGVIDRVLDQVS